MIEAVRESVRAIPGRRRHGNTMMPFEDVLRETCIGSRGDNLFYRPDGQKVAADTFSAQLRLVIAWRTWRAEEEKSNPALALTFQDLRHANLARRGAWRTERDPAAWSLSQWGNALCGELGEACNLIKKIDRGDFTLEAACEDLGNELCDILTYLDLLALCADIDLEGVLRKEWESKVTTLTFRGLRQASLASRDVWHALAARTLPQWGNTLCGGLGEACSLIDKIDFGDLTLEAAREDLGSRLCDVLILLDHLALCAGVDLEEATLRKWNEVSERVGSSVRLVPNFKEQP